TKRASPEAVEERIKHGEKVIRAGSQHPETMSRMSERSPVYQAIGDTWGASFWDARSGAPGGVVLCGFRLLA
ncbi:MAG: hypothetical protein M3Q30_24760, partial [Actinomycetota bacterium]|nr:hypothetical protein [Actinomycetota bacterium]